MAKKYNSALFFLGLVAAVVVGMGGLHLLGGGGGDKPTADAPPPASLPATGAFAQGGRPQTTGPARLLFEKGLPAFVIALDRWGRTHNGQTDSIKEDLLEERAAVIASLRAAELDPVVFPAFEALLDTSMEAAQAKDSDLDEAADLMMKATLALNDAVATAGLGFFVDAEVLSDRRGGRSVLLFCFEVERVVLYRSGGHDVRTLRVRRLDHLNWSYSLLGFTSPQRRDAVVLDNKVDEHLLSLLPALGDVVGMDPFAMSKQDTQTAWYTETRKHAVAIIAEELGDSGNTDLKELGTLLGRRQEVFVAWNELLKPRDYSVELPSQLSLDWDYRRQMEGLVTHAAMDELDEIQQKLVSDKFKKVYHEVHDHFAQSVERHETQHRLDLAQLYSLPMPDALAEYVGDLEGGYQGQDGLAAGAVAEMSAYLSELARDQRTSKLNLTLVVRFLLRKDMWGMGESYAALVIVEELADQLGIAHGPLVMDRRIDREVVAQVYRQMTKVEGHALRAASSALWERMFETELPVLELIAR